MLAIPDHYIQEINKITFNFIWEGKPPKIKKNTIIGEKKDGGLKMCDFKIMEKALKLAWIKRFQDDSQASWKIIPNHIMHKHGSLTFLTKCNVATNTLAHENLPIFYQKILNYWSEFKNSTGYDFKSRHKDKILWNNRNILIAKKTVF